MHKNKVYLYYQCLTSNQNTVCPRCGLPYFRADHVDSRVWHWLKSWLQDSETELERKLRSYKAEQEAANAPVLALLESNDRLLSENRGKLDRLLDLYLDGGLDKETYIARKAQLDEVIASLEEKRAELAARLDQVHNLGDSEIEEIIILARDIRDGLEEADGDFEARRRVIDLLDVRGVLAVEDGEKIVYPTFVLSDKPGGVRLSLVDCAKVYQNK